MKNIEVEIRSFVSEDQYHKLIAFFKEKGNFLHEDDQVTFYFDSEEDLRIQQNNFHSKIILKKGGTWLLRKF